MIEKKEHTEEDESARSAYEVGYLLVPTIPEEDAAGEATKIRDIIEKHGAVVSGAAPLERALAYEIAKRAGGKILRFQKAYFGHFVFETTKEGAADINLAIKKNDKILRFLLVNRTKESLVAPTRRIPRAPEMRQKRTEEKGAPMDEAAVDQEIEKMVAATE